MSGHYGRLLIISISLNYKIRNTEIKDNETKKKKSNKIIRQRKYKRFDVVQVSMQLKRLKRKIGQFIFLTLSYMNTMTNRQKPLVLKTIRKILSSIPCLDLKIFNKTC